MAFIDKKDPVVLNIKLTSKGRELLSEGKLNFSFFALGDSEIDYEFYDDANFDPFYSNVLVPADKNPSLLSFIPRELSGDPYNTIVNVPSTPSIIQNTAQPLGFFNITTGSTSFITDTDHVKQPDVMVKIDEVTGGTTLNLYQSSSYIANVNEPEIGDFILVRWTNKFDITTGTTGYEIDSTRPQPYLFYKIDDIASGSLSSNNLVVVVDRELPDFTNITGGTSGIVAGALIYYNYINFTGDTIFNDFSTDYLNEAVLTFLENCQCPTITFPFWNMSIIFTEEILGVQEDDEKYTEFDSKRYGGFVSYIQNQSPVYKKLGVIHYSNSSPSNTYAEQLYTNIPDGYIPTIDLPTIMWHKSSTNTLGLKLTAIGDVKSLTGETKSLNTAYYDLGDEDNNIVGKVFTDLKLFVIEDPELLFAMSYKSNRSWTLPSYTVGVNDDISVGCTPCTIDFDLVVTNPTVIDGSDGTMTISNIINQIPDSELVLRVSGETSGEIYFQPITTGGTVITGLEADNYFVVIHDLGALDCDGKYVTLTDPTSTLAIYDTETTASGLIDDFNLTIINPTTVGVYADDVGVRYGTLYAGILPYGSTSSVSYSTLGNYKEFNLTFRNAYTIYIKDDVGGGTEFIATKDYVAAGNPLRSTFSISNQATDSGGTYVIMSNYLTTINPSNNPIVGEIEFTIYPSSSIAREWQTLPDGASMGDPIKLYVDTTGSHIVAVRERYDRIEMYRTTRTKTIS